MPYSVSVSSCFDYNIPLEEQMRYVSRAGFTHISLGSDLNHSKFLEPNSTDLIKKFLRENNLKIDTIHFFSHSAQVTGNRYWNKQWKKQNSLTVLLLLHIAQHLWHGKFKTKRK